MTDHFFSRAVVGLAFTALTGSAAGTLAAGTDAVAAQSNRQAQEARPNQPLTITGCLQRAGRTFVVTQRSEPAQKNTGSKGNGAVEREQIRAAEGAYRVSPGERMDLDKMVGKQVRVSGTLVKAADLPAATRSTDHPDIDKGDLAEIKATGIAVVSDNCGSGARK